MCDVNNDLVICPIEPLSLSLFLTLNIGLFSISIKIDFCKDEDRFFLSVKLRKRLLNDVRGLVLF